MTEGLPQLDPAFFGSQLFWLFLTFSILYFSISRVFLPKTSSVIKKREEFFESTDLSIKRNKEEIEILQKKYEEQIFDARKKSEVEIFNANTKANEISSSSVEQLKKDFKFLDHKMYVQLTQYLDIHYDEILKKSLKISHELEKFIQSKISISDHEREENFHKIWNNKLNVLVDKK